MSTTFTRAMRAMAVAFALMLAGVAFVAANPMLAHAAGDTYTVRVWAGNQGTVGGGEVAEYKVAYNAPFTLDESAVTVSDSDKYYVRGFRVSGEDALASESIAHVTGDMDFVVAYGVRGNMVDYTLHCVVYGTGTELESHTHEGKVGDKPVVAAPQIDGYRPLYLNVTGTLSEGTNEWTLEYAPNETETETVVNEETRTTVQNTPAQGGAAAGAAGAGAAGAGAAGAGAAGAAGAGAAGAGAAGAGAGAAGGGAAANPPATEEILDQDTPLASTTSSGDTTGAPANNEANGLLVGAIAALIVLILGLLWLMFRRKKEQEEQGAVE